MEKCSRKKTLVRTRKQNLYEFPEAKNIVVSGDIHGDFTQLVYKCCVQYGLTDTLIIVAGDCGFGFNRPSYYEDLYMSPNRSLGPISSGDVKVFSCPPKSKECLALIHGSHKT